MQRPKRALIDVIRGLSRAPLSATQPAFVSPTLLRYRCLGSDALYWALDVRGEIVVDLEVVDAPGLTRGTPMRVTKAAASRMTRVCRPRPFIGSASASISR
jgi:hypothetical protein